MGNWLTQHRVRLLLEKADEDDLRSVRNLARPVLTNWFDGEFAGRVKVMVSNPFIAVGSVVKASWIFIHYS
jgi:hypothetical protein